MFRLGLGTGSFAATVGTVAPANLIQGVALNVAANDKATAWKVGAGYDFGQGSVNAVYEKLGYTLASNGVDVLGQSNVYLSGKYNVSATDAIKAAYATAGTQKGLAGTLATSGSSAHQLTVGYDHGLSKHTTVYALYSKLTNSNNGTATAGTGSDYQFNQGSSSAAANGGVGASPSVFSLGMKHAF